MTESWDEKRLSFIERLARQEDFFPKNSQKAPEFIYGDEWLRII